MYAKFRYKFSWFYNSIAFFSCKTWYLSSKADTTENIYIGSNLAIGLRLATVNGKEDVVIFYRFVIQTSIFHMIYIISWYTFYEEVVIKSNHFVLCKI